MTQQLINRYPITFPNLRLHLDASLILPLCDLFGWSFSFLGLNALEIDSSLLSIGWMLLLLILLLAAFITLYLLDAYQLKSRLLGFSLVGRTLLANASYAGLSALVLFLCLPQAHFLDFSALFRLLDVTGLGLSLGCFTTWCISLRLLALAWERSCDRNSNWLMLADTETVQQLQDAFSRWTPQSRISCLVDVPSDLSAQAPSDTAQQVTSIGSFQHLKSWLYRPWTAVLVSPTANLSMEQQKDLMQLRLRGGSIYNLVDFCEQFWYKLPPNLLQANWFTFKAGFSLNQSRSVTAFKRLWDIALISLLLIIMLPVMILAAIAIKLSSPGPVLYSQLRTGLNGDPFRVYKFRSMYQDAEKRGAQWASERDPRITPVGHWLRILRIDELPQIWNVLKGDMSLIGPRPERPEFDQELAKAIPYYQVRYSVKPGITGWAQVMYPYGASVEDAYEKVSYDFYYIKNYSLWLDLVIVLKTVRVVLFGKGR